MEKIASLFLYTGSFILLSGIITLTYLQSKLIGKLNKSLFTFLSVMFYPNHELSDTELKIKSIGNYLTIIGSLIALIAGFFVWLTR